MTKEVYDEKGLAFVSLSIFVVNFKNKKQDEVYKEDEEFAS